MNMVGSQAANFHEGTRSEYLAHYVFSSFGTCVPVPHPEDTGLDLHCTLTERVGQRIWPTAYYSMQVKSTEEPWLFADPKSIRWLVEYPLPIFFCIVSKKELTIRVYSTTGRFSLHQGDLLPDVLRLVPDCSDPNQLIWKMCQETLNLGNPILRFSLHELLDGAFHEKIRQVLNFWNGVDRENLFRRQAGMQSCELPQCETNSTDFSTVHSSELKGTFEDFKPYRPRLLRVLRWIADQALTWGAFSTFSYAELLIRQLKKDAAADRSGDVLTFAKQVNTRCPTEPPGCTLLHAVEGLGQHIDAILSMTPPAQQDDST